MVHEDIENTIDAIVFISEHKYTINSITRDIDKIKIIDPYSVVHVETLENSDQSSSIEKNKEMYFAKVLSTDIYNLLYNATSLSSRHVACSRNDFISDLSNSNNGNGTWEYGWKYIGEAETDEHAMVSRNGVVFFVPKTEIKFRDNIDDAGCICWVKIPKEIRNLNVNFYMAFGNSSDIGQEASTEDVVRFYWNLMASGAVDYMRLITSEFNHFGFSFKTKVISDPKSYDRSDAGVLYVRKKDLREVLPIVQRVHHEIRRHLRTTVPLFSRRLHNGLALAEDPRDTLSFGFSRAKTIADALISCLANKGGERRQFIQSVQSAFESQGIDPMNPYALKVNVDDYERILRTFSFCNLQE